MPRMHSQRAVLWGVLICVALNAGSQVLFKAVRAAHPDAAMFSLFLQLGIWAGFILCGLSAMCWLWVLSRAQLSFAYPMLSLTFPIVVALSVVLFSEAIVPMRWAGVGVIVIGVSLLART